MYLYLPTLIRLVLLCRTQETYKKIDLKEINRLIILLFIFNFELIDISLYQKLRKYFLEQLNPRKMNNEFIIFELTQNMFSI